MSDLPPIDDEITEIVEGTDLSPDRRINRPPLVEAVSQDEVYLVDDFGNRIKRVCGAQRVGKPKGWVCLRPAGDGAGRLNWGPCSEHEPHEWSDDRMHRAVTLESADLPVDHPLRKIVEQVRQRNQRIDLTLPIPELNSLYVLKELRLRRFHELGHLETDDVAVFNRAVDKLREDDLAIAELKEKIGKMRQASKAVTLEHIDALFAMLQSWVLETAPNSAVVSIMLSRLSRIQATQNGMVLIDSRDEVSAQ